MFDWLRCVENMMQQFFEWLHSLFTWQLWPFSAERIFWCLFHCYSFMLVFICELIWFPFPPFRATCQRLLLWNVLACNSKQESTWTIIIIIIFTPHMSKWHRLHDGHVSDDWIFKRWEWMIFQPHDASCEESIIRSGTTTATVGSLTEPIEKLSQVY